MPVDFPSKTDQSLGRPKADALQVSDLNTQLTAAELERIKDQIVAQAEELGHPDGSTPSSVWEAIANVATIEGPEGPQGPPGPQGPAGATGADGADGAQGPQGIQGPAGADGADGAQGPQGIQGPQGPQGPAGADGADGPSAYDVWIAEGNSGTEQDFLNSLVGADGADGAQGPQGIQGPQGPQGPAGADGADGTSVGLKGSVADFASLPPGATQGDLWITLDSGDGWVSDGAEGWTNVGPIQGPQGIQGPAGADGADGAQGPQGIQGPAGADGADGAQGPQGIQGPQGPQGPAGADGADGPSAYDVWIAEGNSGTEQDFLNSLVGADGADGAQGPQGIQGPAGADGADGAQGPQGIQGPAGADGSDATVTKPAVEAVLTGEITSHTHPQGNSRAPVKAATVAAAALATDFEDGDALDGVTLATGDRILIKNQLDPVENGIYVVQATGAPARASDFDTGDAADSTTVVVQQGAANADSAWLCIADSPADIIGTNELLWNRSGGMVTIANIGQGDLEEFNSRIVDSNIGNGVIANKAIVALVDVNGQPGFPPGIDGSQLDNVGAGVTLQEQGADVAGGATFSKLNLEGAGVASITDAGGGVANVQISGGGGTGGVGAAQDSAVSQKSLAGPAALNNSIIVPVAIPTSEIQNDISVIDGTTTSSEWVLEQDGLYRLSIEGTIVPDGAAIAIVQLAWREGVASPVTIGDVQEATVPAGDDTPKMFALTRYYEATAGDIVRFYAAAVRGSGAVYLYDVTATVTRVASTELVVGDHAVSRVMHASATPAASFAKVTGFTATPELETDAAIVEWDSANSRFTTHQGGEYNVILTGEASGAPASAVALKVVRDVTTDVFAFPPISVDSGFCFVVPVTLPEGGTLELQAEQASTGATIGGVRFSLQRQEIAIDGGGAGDTGGDPTLVSAADTSARSKDSGFTYEDIPNASVTPGAGNWLVNWWVEITGSAAGIACGAGLAVNGSDVNATMLSDTSETADPRRFGGTWHVSGLADAQPISIRWFRVSGTINTAKTFISALKVA